MTRYTDDVSAETRRRRLRTKTRVVAKAQDDYVRELERFHKKPIGEWDWEELARGKPRDPRTGGFVGGSRPEWITPAVQAEARRRMKELTEEELMVSAETAIGVLNSLMRDTETDEFGKPIVAPSVKLDAAKYILNHVIGTPKARVKVEQTNPLIELMGGILVNPDNQPSHQVIDVEVVEESEDDDE